jgi:hypothetical protein
MDSAKKCHGGSIIHGSCSLLPKIHKSGFQRLQVPSLIYKIREWNLNELSSVKRDFNN